MRLSSSHLENDVKVHVKDGLPSGMFVRLNHGHSIRVSVSVKQGATRLAAGHERSSTCRRDIKKCARMQARNNKRVAFCCWLPIKERD